MDDYRAVMSGYRGSSEKRFPSNTDPSSRYNGGAKMTVIGLTD